MSISTTLRPLPEVVAMLAQAQPPESLLALFERHAPDANYQETLTCLAQEMVLRGTDVVGAASVFWKQHVVADHHPLSRLPLNLLPEEQMFPGYLRHYNTRGASWSTSSTSEEMVNAASASINLTVTWTEAVLSEHEAEQLRSAVVNWKRESNGKLESRIFHSNTILSAEAVTPALVLSLPLECLAGTPEVDLLLNMVSVAEALSTLFSAACTGGAYNGGVGGAYGRLEAWKSLAAFVGAEENNPIETVVEQAGRCTWFSFFAKSAWFYDVAWDLGLIALRPDGRTLAILAATDTD
jgi:hypothetical protein